MIAAHLDALSGFALGVFVAMLLVTVLDAICYVIDRRRRGRLEP